MIFCSYDLCDLHTFPVETGDDLCGLLKIVLRPVGWDMCIYCSRVYAHTVS